MRKLLGLTGALAMLSGMGAAKYDERPSPRTYGGRQVPRAMPKQTKEQAQAAIQRAQEKRERKRIKPRSDDRG